MTQCWTRKKNSGGTYTHCSGKAKKKKVYGPLKSKQKNWGGKKKMSKAQFGGGHKFKKKKNYGPLKSKQTSWNY